GDVDRAGHPLLGHAPGGGYRAARVTPDAGALLPHRFTLACAAPANRCSHRRSALCCPEPTGHPVLALASTLPCGVPTFLDTGPSGEDQCRGHPAGSPSRAAYWSQSLADHGVSLNEDRT